jgi:hypothetical protein
MPPGIELFRSLSQQAQMNGSKSTALSPLGWALAILVSGLLGSLYYRAPSGVMIFFGASIAVVLISYLAAYFIFLARSPDYLRSERYSLSKMAIEKSLRGDNISGATEQDENALPAMPTPSDHRLEDQR